MEYAEKVLLVGGVIVLAAAFLLGIPMAQARMKAPMAPRALTSAHMEALIGGTVLIALTIALSFSDLNTKVESLAAWALVAGVASAVSGGVLNWRQGVEDAFATKPPGFYLQAAAGPLNLAGIALVVIGVISGL